MTPEQFVYWLQEYMKLADSEKLGIKETAAIKDNLAKVYMGRVYPPFIADSTNTSIYDNPIADPKLPHVVYCNEKGLSGRFPDTI